MEKVLFIREDYLENSSINIFGDMLSYFTGDGLYLSGNSISFTQKEYDFYSGTKSISAYFPPFSGAPVPYEPIDINQIKFRLPKNLPAGDYDIIFCNPAGYVKGSSLKTFSKLTVLPLSSI